MWVAPSAGRDDTAIAECRGGVSLDSEMNATPSGSGSRNDAALSAIVDRRGIDTRHAGYFDGEWERP